MNEKYEPIKFETWQELAKFVIDGGEVYFQHKRISFDVDESQFNFVFTDHLRNNLFIKKQPTLEELIAIKPRLCWVWDYDKNSKSIKVVYNFNKNSDHPYLLWNNVGFKNAQMLTDDEIKQFLSDGDDK
jgi:hypothetical protein